MNENVLEEPIDTKKSDFVHLHVHTQYSVLDGHADISNLLNTAKDLGMDAMAITDHGSMFGVLDFHNQCKKVGIKPIIGCEFYIANGSRFDRKAADVNESTSYHLILLAKNAQGYQNLCRLCSIGYREGFYYRPRIDKEVLKKYSEGVIACSACIGGEIPKLLNHSTQEKAEQSLREYLDIFGDDFYLELQNHGIEDQKNVNPKLAELAKKYNIKLVATNDIHFVKKEDFKAHQILVCLNTGKKLGDQHQMMYSGEEYLKSEDEMNGLFPEYPEAITNTREIADKVEVYEITRDIILPKFPLPEGISSEMEYLRKLTMEGAVERWGNPIPEEILERINFELDTVEKMGFPGYFLIVWDFIKKAREMDVLVGPGRGSAAGSAITYAIKITNVDPIKYNLLFERFLNPERISMPDMDIDFDDAGREKVIEYVVNKYGEDCVAQIITFGTMAAKSSIKDVARVLDLPLSESDRLTKLLPDRIEAVNEKTKEKEELKITVKNSLKYDKKFQEESKSPNPLIADTIKYAEELEGSIRSTGTHACGMIIAPESLMNVVPISTAKGTDMPVVQFEGSIVESAGLLKMDFLGLSTLTIIKNCLINIKQRHNIDIDIEAIPLDDPLTYELFARGDTFAIFQFESDGMRKHMIDLKPNRFEDLIAMNALYRPGPMDYIPSFIARKLGKEKITYDLEGMDEFLEETYGICVYQEQVMLLSQKLANFTKGDADALRKAMGKKKRKELDKMYPKFIDGCKANNYDIKICEKIWKDWEAFASYAFNKSHATCYAYVAYQTAYLKAHYPAEFMAAALTNDVNDISKIGPLTAECKRMGIPILGPDINESQNDFTVNSQGAIRFGLAAVKGVGGSAVEGIIGERQENGVFKDIFDFAKRIDLRKFNKRCFESLAKAGGFDSFKDIHRAQFFMQNLGEETNFIDKLINFAAKIQKNANSSQISLFGESAEDDSVANPMIPPCDPWSEIVCLQMEKEVTGFYISGHPLDNYKLEQKQFANCVIADFKGKLPENKGRELRFIGTITKVEHLTAKNGNLYGRFTVQDFEDSLEIMLFGEDYLKFRNYMLPNAFVFIHASVQNHKYRKDEYEFKVLKFNLLEDYLDKHTKTLNICAKLNQINADFIENIQVLAKGFSGNASLNFEIIDPDLQCILNMPSRAHRVRPKDFIEALSGKHPDIEIRLASN